MIRPQLPSRPHLGQKVSDIIDYLWLSKLWDCVKYGMDIQGDGKTISVNGRIISARRRPSSGDGGAEAAAEHVGMFKFEDASDGETLQVRVINEGDPDGAYAGKLVAGLRTDDVARVDALGVSETCYGYVSVANPTNAANGFIPVIGVLADWPEQDMDTYYDVRAIITVEEGKITSIKHIKKGVVEVAGRIV